MFKMLDITYNFGKIYHFLDLVYFIKLNVQVLRLALAYKLYQKKFDPQINNFNVQYYGGNHHQQTFEGCILHPCVVLLFMFHSRKRYLIACKINNLPAVYSNCVVFCRTFTQDAVPRCVYTVCALCKSMAIE